MVIAMTRQYLGQPGMPGDGSEAAPRAAVSTRSYTAGISPLRVLLLGDAPAMDSANGEHDTALGGQLSSAIATMTSRSAVVDVRADPRMTPQCALGIAQGIDLARYDAIVVALGSFDATRLTPLRSFVGAMAALLDHIEHATRCRAPIAVASIPRLPPQLRNSVSRAARAQSHADLLNTALLTAVLPVTMCAIRLCADDSGPETVEARGWRWAGKIVRGLRGIEAIPERAELLPTRQSERRRQDSLTQTGVLGPLSRKSAAAFDEIVEDLQSSLAMPIVALNFIADELLWVKSVRGFPLGPFDRSQSFCNTTIQEGTTLVVPDLAADRRFDLSPFVSAPDGLRFYAGHPVEAPDGQRVGSLCVLDNRIREFSERDAQTLQAFALRAQRELFALS